MRLITLAGGITISTLLKCGWLRLIPFRRLKLGLCIRPDSMRMQILEDSKSPAGQRFQPCELHPRAVNDTYLLHPPASNPAEAYLASLSQGSRRAMTQALDVVASIILPGATVANLDWGRVGYAEVTRVRSALAAKYSPAMGNKCLAALRGALKATFRLGLIDADSLARAVDVPSIRGARVPKGRSLQMNEIAGLIAACDRSRALGVRNAALIAIGFGCGLRRAELVGLDISDVLDNGHSLRVTGKGNKQRVVYLPEGTTTHLAAWLAHRGHREGPLFCPSTPPDRSSRRLTEQTVYDVVHALARKAGLDDVSPHDLRRSFVSALLDQGVSLSTVSAMAGHSDVSTTARYDRRGEHVKRQAANLLTVTS